MDAQALLYQSFQTLAGAARRLPRGAALAFADGVAAAAYAGYRCSPVRGFIRANLRAAYGPGPADAELDGIARAHVRELARNIAEVMRLPKLRAEYDAVVAGVDGWAHVEAARAEGRGVIVATCHYGNWEVLGAVLAHRGLPLHVLVQRPSQDAFDRLFNETRAACGVASWENAGPASLRPVLRALARGEALGLLADQHGEAQDAIVRLFDRPVAAPTGPFFFARRTGAAVLPMRTVREADGRHRVIIEAAIPPSGDDEADMQRLYATYERWIRERPTHWLWVHDRWAREQELQRAPREVVAPPRDPVGAPR